MFEEFEIAIPIIVVMSSFKDISQGQYMRHDWSISQAEFHRTPRWKERIFLRLNGRNLIEIRMKTKLPRLGVYSLASCEFSRMISGRLACF